jgi:hypothetical protein
MMVRGYVGVALLIFALVACAAKPAVQQSPELPEVSSRPAVHWQGHELREVTSLKALPASIREALHVDRPGVNGVADRDQPFSATDVVIEPRPMRRFITAGQDGNLWLVVLEYGGLASGVMAIQFAGGDRVGSWIVPCLPEDRPRTLKDAVRAISSSSPMMPARRTVLPSS